MRGLMIITASASLALWFSPSNANAEDLFLSDANGCKVYDPSPEPDETVTWSGRCLDGYADGSGVVQWLDGATPGTRVEGTLVRGKWEGQTSVLNRSGGRFEGSYHEGERSGKGALTWPNGDRYEGDWQHNKRTGGGVLTRANGDRYEGDFVDGKWSGKGTFTTSAGGRYTGDWVNNKEEGQGEQIWPDGSRYVGPFVNGKPADPKLVVRQTYSIKETETGSLIPEPVVSGISVPVDKSYEQLTPQEKLRVKSLYESMGEGDEPPYPLHGTRQLYEAAEKLQNTLGITGELALVVTVDRKGKPLKVESLRSADKEMTAAMAKVLLLEKYKPALCKGVPCQMQYPFRIKFGVSVSIEPKTTTHY
jgi:hypothetical protein